jgi:hypothetical protein
MVSIARIDRAHSDRARSASTETIPATSPSSILRARIPLIRRTTGRPILPAYEFGKQRTTTGDVPPLES